MDWVYVGFNEKPQEYGEGSEEREVGWVAVFFFVLFFLPFFFFLSQGCLGRGEIRKKEIYV